MQLMKMIKIYYLDLKIVLQKNFKIIQKMKLIYKKK